MPLYSLGMPNRGWSAMTGSGTTDIVLPIVIAVCLVTWLSLVFWANAHPTRGRYKTDLRTEVRGGSFQAVEGGRQLMPIPEHRPAVPGQRAAAASETYRAAGATATATAMTDDDRAAEEDTTPLGTRPPR
jgi:hypothetical protein